jgi:sec-independent protein translocase protein TatB
VFNLSGSEVLFILVIGLVILGPEKLPEMLRRAGRLYGELRRMSQGVQAELKSALDEPTRELRQATKSARTMLNGGVVADAAGNAAAGEGATSPAPASFEPTFIPYPVESPVPPDAETDHRD